MKVNMQNRSWSDLSPAAKVGVIVVGTIQVALLALTLWDLRSRPAEEINGDKRMWAGIAFINWFGPLAYFTVGRKDGLARLRDMFRCEDSGEEV